MTDKNSALDHTVGTFPIYPTMLGTSVVSPVVNGVPMYDGVTKHGLLRTNLVLPESAQCPWPSSPPLSGRKCPPGTDKTTIGKTCCTAYDVAGAANLGQAGYGYYPAMPASVQWGPRQPMPSVLAQPVAAGTPVTAALAAGTPVTAALAAGTPVPAALAAGTPVPAALAAGTPVPAAPADAVAAALAAGGKKYEALKERANRNIHKARKNIVKLKSMCTDLLKLNDDLIKQNKKLKSHIAGGKCGCETE